MERVSAFDTAKQAQIRASLRTARAQVRYDPKVETADETLSPASPTLAPARLRETIEEVRTRMERVREFHKVKQEQMRGAIRTRLLDRAHDALDRMDAEHIVSWSHEHGLHTFGNSSTREATEAAIERRRLVFEEVTLGMVKLELEMLALASSTHVIFVGQAGASREVKGLMPEEFRAVAQGFAALDKAIMLRTGQATERSEATVSKVPDAILRDHECRGRRLPNQAQSGRRAPAGD
jgi:hypothetical protein